MSKTYPSVQDCSMCGKPFWSTGSDICFPCSYKIPTIAEKSRAYVRRVQKPKPIAKPKKEEPKPEAPAVLVPVSKAKLKEIARRVDLINRQRKTKAGYVYLMRSANGLYKIGRSKNTKKRKAELNRQFPIQIGIIHLVLCRDYCKAEKDLHRKYRQKRVESEWFNLSAQDVAWLLSLKDGDLD